mmetsp:Transcript_103424/g.301753  ORF Transcript_103424/g.301753 Transcript_103424/m.301753 type:complete len:231 (-) Transcript_103424:1423-2115(-)
MDLAWMRWTPMSSTLMGPSMTSTTSLTSSRRTTFSLMPMPADITAPFTTFMYLRMNLMKASCGMLFSPSSLRWTKSFCASSADGPGSLSFPSASASFDLLLSSHLRKNPRKSDSSMLPSLLASNSAKSASIFSSDSCWYHRMVLKARARMPSSSSATFFLASARAFLSQAATFAERVSRPFIRRCSFLTSPLRKALCSDVSKPSLRELILSIVAVTRSFASFMASSTWLA